jgi:hypothetical protein
MSEKPLKEYILVMDWVDVGHALNSVAHAVLVAHKKWSDDPEYQDWYNNYFRKVTCKVSPQQFEKAKSYEGFVVITESAFDGKEVAIVFKPRREWPKFFSFLSLYA